MEGGIAFRRSCWVRSSKGPMVYGSKGVRCVGVCAARVRCTSSYRPTRDIGSLARILHTAPGSPEDKSDQWPGAPSALGRYARAMVELHVLFEGYVRAGDELRVASTVSLVRDGDRFVIVDPGLVPERAAILGPLAALGVDPDQSPTSCSPPSPRSHRQRRAVPRSSHP